MISSLLLALFLAQESFDTSPMVERNTIVVETPCYPTYTYEPKEDITVYELSKIVILMFHAQTFYDPESIEAHVKDLGTAARHLKKSECPK